MPLIPSVPPAPYRVEEGPTDPELFSRISSSCSASLPLLAVASLAMLLLSLVRGDPVTCGPFTLDTLGTTMATLVSVIGAVAYRFSIQHLEGEVDQDRFLGGLLGTVLAAWVLMLSTHLLMLFAAWTLTSAGLHALLTHYRHRREVQRPAWKKFFISRFGDAMFLIAICLIYAEHKTLDLLIFLNSDPGRDGHGAAIALLVVMAALAKSAQFPVHSWLPETMGAPTPVSALMHAGIINAGGVLLLRFAPFLVNFPLALALLSVVGTLSLVLGNVSMWAQTDIKRALAWSTVSQLGFMVAQCGQGAFHAAALHILGHGSYKAWSFLAAGTPSRSPSVRCRIPMLRRLLLFAAGTISGHLLMRTCPPPQGTASAFTHLALSIAVGHLFVALLGPGSRDLRGTGLRASGAVVLGASLVALSHALLGLSVSLFPHLPPAPHDLPAWVQVPALGGLLFLTLLHLALPRVAGTPPGRAFRTHARQGFYIGLLADRLVDFLRGRTPEEI